jgi:DNA-binding GntR family transcriptional regulator
MTQPVSPSTLGGNHRPLRDVVAAELRRMILDGTLKQGERLIEDRLAEQLGVSRNPVREAIRMLEAEGFLEVTARRGCFVATLSGEQGADLFEVRLVMEPLGARLAARHMRAADDSERQAAVLHVARMKEIMAEVEATAGGQELDALSELHTELHSIIFELTGNSYLIAIAIPMVKRGQWLLRQSAPLSNPSAWYQHHELIGAIEAGDPDLAEAVARHHVLSVRSELLT